MALTKKTSNSSTSSSSAPVAVERCTTRAMKAKAAKEAASSGSQDNTTTSSQDATSSAAKTSPSTDNSTKKSTSKSGEQTSKITKGKQASGNANTTTHKNKAKATSTNKKTATSSAPAKGKGKAKASETEPKATSTGGKKGKGKASKKQPIKKVADTSHLILKKKSHNGKLLVNSNGRPANFQAAIDTSVDRWINAELKKPCPWGTQIPAVSAPNMRDDFKDMGFPSDEISNMMSRRETIKVDGATQRPMHDGGKHVKDTGPAPVKKTRSPRGQAAPKYAESFVWDKQPWILFDPLKGYPDGSGLVPEGITKWETYQPGNARLLLQHRNSKSIISRAPPAALAGQTVDYTPSGPRVAGWEPIGSEKTAPEPEPDEEPAAAAAAATTAPPLLGRGACRATRVPASSEATAPPPAAGKRKAEAISSDAAPPSSPAPPVAAEGAPALKRAKTSPPSEAGAPTPAGENLAGEGKQKRKRRPGRPKKSAARVENSSSE